MFQLDEKDLLAAVGQLYLHNLALQKQLEDKQPEPEPKPDADRVE